MVKLNCWEFKNCGREPGGVNVYELGVCPVAIEKRANGFNDGKNGGRVCWTIADTLCTGKSQRTIVEKLTYCMDCEFFKMVSREEGFTFKGCHDMFPKLNE